MDAPEFPPMDAASDAIDKAVQAYQRELERELRGAWMAGYEYLHVFKDEPALTAPSEMNTLHLQRWVMPSKRQAPPNPDSLWYRHTYDLTSIPDEVLRDAIKRGA